MHGKTGKNKWLQVADRCWKQTTIERKLITSSLQERKTKQLVRWTLKHPDSRRNKPQIHSRFSQDKKKSNQNTQSNSPRLIPHGICAFITRNTRRKKTLKISRPKNDSETKTKQNKTKQNLKKEKKSFFRRYKIAFSTTYKRKENGDHTWSLFQEQDFKLTW